MSGPMTDDERDFMRDVSWSASLGWLSGETEPRAEVEHAVRQLLDQLAEMHPNRAKRLLILSVLAGEAKAESDMLLRDLIDGWFHWTYRDDIEQWCSLGVQDYEKGWLARLLDVPQARITRLVKDVMNESLDRAIAEREAAS